MQPAEELPICLDSGGLSSQYHEKTFGDRRTPPPLGNKDKMGRASDKVNDLHPDV